MTLFSYSRKQGYYKVVTSIPYYAMLLVVPLQSRRQLILAGTALVRMLALKVRFSARSQAKFRVWERD